MLFVLMTPEEPSLPPKFYCDGVGEQPSLDLATRFDTKHEADAKAASIIRQFNAMPFISVSGSGAKAYLECRGLK